MSKNRSILDGKGGAALQLLLVDDDAIIQILHKKIVSDILPGIPVVPCKHGAEAIEHIQAECNRHVNFLVLLDINMPVMNGWEFLETCQRNNWNHLKVVLVSSSINQSDRKAAADFPQVFRYCEKPLDKLTFTEITLENEVAPLLRGL